MEFVQQLTYIWWSFVLCQLITSTVTLQESYDNESLFQEAVINELQVLRTQMKDHIAQSENKILTLISEMEALKLENAKLKQEADGFNSAIAGSEKEISALRSEMEEVKKVNEKVKKEVDGFKSDIADKKSTQADNFVSFTAVISTDVYNAPGEAVIFDRVLRNYGDGYSSETGVFTCVVSGYYLWFVHLYTQNDNDISAEIFIQNQEDVMPELLSPASGNDDGSTLGVSYCAAGSGVWVRVTQIGGSTFQSDSFRHNTFSGVLLSIVV